MISNLPPIILAFLSAGLGTIFPHYTLSMPSFSDTAYGKDIATLERSAGLPISLTRNEPVMRLKQDSDAVPALTARSVLLVDATQGSVLFSDNAEKEIPLASLTKLATVITFLELHIPATNRVIISASDVVDARSALAAGDDVSVNDLIGLTIVGSSNSAAKALITASGLSPEYFVGRMNVLARELGLSHMRFVEPTGLNAGNVGTALEVYRLLDESGHYPEVRAFAQKDSYTFWNGKEEKTMKATDELVAGGVPFRGKNIVAAKTGYIPESGYHVALIAKDENGNDRIVIIMGAQSTYARFQEADEVLHWGANNFVK